MEPPAGSLRLYYASGACSLAPHIALYESGLGFDAIRVDLQTRKMAADDSQSYDSINSKGYVPALRLANREILTEVGVILQYVADQVPALMLAPAVGTMERYRLMEWLSFVSSELHRPFSPLFSPVATDDMRQFARNRIMKRADWLEKATGSHEYLMGNRFTVADAYLFTVLNWFDWRGLGLANWPILQRFHRRVQMRAAVQCALIAEGPHEFDQAPTRAQRTCS